MRGVVGGGGGGAGSDGGGRGEQGGGTVVDRRLGGAHRRRVARRRADGGAAGTGGGDARRLPGARAEGGRHQAPVVRWRWSGGQTSWPTRGLRTPFVDPTAPGGDTYNEKTMLTLAEYMRQRGSR
eukprot:2519897-Pleurochrysis_carterae.AAC.2